MPWVVLILALGLGVLAFPARAQSSGDAELCYQRVGGQGDLDEGIAACTRALKPGWLPLGRPTPENQASIYINRSMLHQKKGDLDQAIEDISIAIRLDPTNSKAYSMRGYVYTKKSMHELARNDYSKTLELDPNNKIIKGNLSSTYTNLSIEYVKKGEFDKAIASASAAIEINSTNPLAYNNRGIAFQNKGKIEQAIADFNVAVRLSPKDGLFYTNRAFAYLKKGDFDQAIADLDRLIRFNPRSSKVYNALGNAYANKLDYERARESYSKALELDPSDKEARDYILSTNDVAANIRLGGIDKQTGTKVAQKEELQLDQVLGRKRAAETQAANAEQHQATLVRRAKAALTTLGQLTGPVDGSLEPSSLAALDAFRREFGRLGEVGKAPDEALVAELEAVAEKHKKRLAQVEQQERDRQIVLVRRAQAVLNELGYSIGSPNGKLGPKTKRALEVEGVRLADGKFDEATVDMLEVRAKSRLEERRIAAEQQKAQELTRQRAEAEAGRQEQQRFAAEREAQARAEAERTARSTTENEATTSGKPATPSLAVAALPTDSAQTTSARPESPARDVPADGRKVALVIGNGAYRPEGGMPPLPNPVNDATAVATALERVGFRVFKDTDLSRTEMEDLGIEFGRAAERADVALTFYAGHGLQVGGRNYLVPVDARIKDGRDLRRLIAADSLVEDASNARQLAVVMLDACRDNPLARGLAGGAARSAAVGRGLARPSQVPAQTLIAYATAEGATADDGGGRNSPFTAAFLKHLAEPGLEVRLLFGKVRDSVVAATGGEQRPNIYGDLGGEPIYLVPKAVEPQEQEPAMALEERRAVQQALATLGFYRGPADGVPSPELRVAIRDLQRELGGAPATGYVTPGQLVELHRLARVRRPPEKLPRLGLIQVLQESEAGEAEAQLHRGMLHDARYEAGALPKDAKEAARWYRRAAEAGNARAALNLGRMLAAGGEGGGRDPAEAARLLRLAVEGGEGEARLELAGLLLDGPDRERNEVEAVRLLRSAAAVPGGPGGAEAIARLRLIGAWEVGETAGKGAGAAGVRSRWW